MATVSPTQAKICPGYRSETTITVADSSAGTWTAKYRDRFGNDLGTVTAAAGTATTVVMTMTATVTSDIARPASLGFQDNEATLGRWYLFLDDSDASGDACEAFGEIVYQRAFDDTQLPGGY